MRVLVDLDGVVADWGAGYDYLADNLGLHAHGGVPYSQRPTWDLNAGLTDEGRAINETIMNWCGFYQDLPLIPGALPAIKALEAVGHDIWFVSTPFLTHETCASEKMQWVQEHMPVSLHKKVILTMDKTLIRGDVLIDDKPEVTGIDRPQWKHLCFGEYGYSNLTQSDRVRDWYEVENAVTLLQWERELLNTKVVD